jgi:hypothetical protein
MNRTSYSQNLQFRREEQLQYAEKSQQNKICRKNVAWSQAIWYFSDTKVQEHSQTNAKWEPLKLEVI